MEAVVVEGAKVGRVALQFSNARLCGGRVSLAAVEEEGQGGAGRELTRELHVGGNDMGNNQWAPLADEEVVMCTTLPMHDHALETCTNPTSDKGCSIWVMVVGRRWLLPPPGR